MKYIEGNPEAPPYAIDGLPVIELTRRNLETLLDKLNDPASKRTLIDPHDRVRVRAVENAEHYSDRRPGVVYMPSAGEYR